MTRALASTAVAIGLVAVVFSTVQPFVSRPATALGNSDYLAFGCAARVADARHDPYLAAPLMQCQRAAHPAADLEIDPAPFPPYFFAMLAPLGALPFLPGGLLWVAGSILAVGVAYVGLRRLTALPWWVLAPPLVVLDFATNVPSAQIPPFVVACVSLAALALRAGRDRWAALAVAGTAIEPHVALPLWLALAVWRPRSRPVLALAGLALVGGSLAIGPASRWLEYATSALPVQAVAEAAFTIQYSLTFVAEALHATDRLAVAIGGFDYAVTVVAAVPIAGLLARRLGDAAYVATFPAAAVLLGGAYIHLGQMAVALPFGFALLARAAASRERSTTIAAAATLAMLACAWPLPLQRSMIAGSLVVVGSLAAFAAHGLDLRKVTFGVLLACVGYGAIAVGVGAPHSLVRAAPSASAFARLADPALAATQDGIDLRRDAGGVTIRLDDLTEKLPVWCALVALWTFALAALRARPRVVAPLPVRS